MLNLKGTTTDKDQHDIGNFTSHLTQCFHQRFQASVRERQARVDDYEAVPWEANAIPAVISINLSVDSIVIGIRHNPNILLMSQSLDDQLILEHVSERH